MPAHPFHHASFWPTLEIRISLRPRVSVIIRHISWCPLIRRWCQIFALIVPYVYPSCRCTGPLPVVDAHSASFTAPISPVPHTASHGVLPLHLSTLSWRTRGLKATSAPCNDMMTHKVGAGTQSHGAMWHDRSLFQLRGWSWWWHGLGATR
jgi:hypothetical protein